MTQFTACGAIQLTQLQLISPDVCLNTRTIRPWHPFKVVGFVMAHSPGATGLLACIHGNWRGECEGRAHRHRDGRMRQLNLET